VVGVFLTVLLSDFTKAWQLYLGVFFIIIVMYAPGGIASLLMMNVRLMVYKRFAKVWPRLLSMMAASLVACVGGVMVIEMLYHLTLESSNGTVMRLFGMQVDTAGVTAWLIAAALIAIGVFLFLRARPAFRQTWDEANLEIEEMIRKEHA
jgi:branched-chain amino acid transport system permease protein